MNIYFYNESTENMKFAINNFETYENTEKRKITHYLLDVIMYDSEGNQYSVVDGFDHKPTEEEIYKCAEKDYNAYAYEDDDEDEYISNSLQRYFLISKEELQDC